MNNPKNDPTAPNEHHVTAINQIFTEFQLAYHNQFHKAFADDQQIIMAKQLWAKTLCDIPPERIVAGCRKAIKDSEYLPNLPTLRKYCALSPEEMGLPDARNAYLEACRAASPKIEQTWSHPAVYLAGIESDWFFLASNSEQKALPVFKRNYDRLCERVMSGEQLVMPAHQALPETINKGLNNQERKDRLKTLRQELDI